MRPHSPWYKFVLIVVALSVVWSNLFTIAAAFSNPEGSPTALNSPPADPPPPPRPPRPRGSSPQPPTADNDDPFKRAEYFYARRIAGDPNANFTIADAAAARLQAAQQVAAQPRIPRINTASYS